MLKVRMAVDLDAIDRLMFFRRGESARTRQVPTWFGLRRRTVSSPTTRGCSSTPPSRTPSTSRTPTSTGCRSSPGSTIIKLFQNVPRDDLEMVLPNVQVRMRRHRQAAHRRHRRSSPGIVVIVTKLLASLGLLLLLLAAWARLQRRAGDARPGRAALGRRRAARVRRLPVAAGHQVQEPEDPVHEGAVGEPVLPQPRQRRRRVPPPARRGRGGRGEGGRAGLPLHPHRAAAAHRRASWTGGSRSGSSSAGTRGSTSRSRTGCASSASCRWSPRTRQGRLSAVNLTEARLRMDRIWDALFDTEEHLIPSARTPT